MTCKPFKVRKFLGAIINRISKILNKITVNEILNNTLEIINAFCISLKSWNIKDLVLISGRKIFWSTLTEFSLKFNQLVRKETAQPNKKL